MDARRVAARHLAGAAPMRRVVRRDEAQALVARLDEIQLRILQHLAGQSGSVVSGTGSYVTLSAPGQAQHLAGGLDAARDLERAGWLRKVEQNPQGTFFAWFLTDGAQRVLRYVDIG